MFVARKLTGMINGLVFLSAILVACAPVAQPQVPEKAEPPAQDPTLSHTGEIGGYGELIDALRGAGAQVDPAGEIQQPFFPGTGQVIKVNGADVQVFEFSDEVTREAAAGLVSTDGSSIGTTMVTWVEPPHFWAKGRLIVLYVGSEKAVIDLLSGAMGDPIAG